MRDVYKCEKCESKIIKAYLRSPKRRVHKKTANDIVLEVCCVNCGHAATLQHGTIEHNRDRFQPERYPRYKKQS